MIECIHRKSTNGDIRKSAGARRIRRDGKEQLEQVIWANLEDVGYGG
jgi:hypothetical protein